MKTWASMCQLLSAFGRSLAGLSHHLKARRRPVTDTHTGLADSKIRSFGIPLDYEAWWRQTIAVCAFLLFAMFASPADAAEPFRCQGSENCYWEGTSIHPTNATDFAIGAKNLVFDGYTKYYRVSYYDAAFGGNRVESALYQLDSGACPPGNYGLHVLLVGTYCYPPYSYGAAVMFYYAANWEPGNWRFEYASGDVPDPPPSIVTPFEMRPAVMSKAGGDEQLGVIGQALTAPLIVQLKDGEGNPVNFPYYVDFYNNYPRGVFTATITGPRRSSGASVTFDGENYPHGGNGLASMKVVLGDTIGTYTIKVTHKDAAADAVLTFTATAVKELPPDAPGPDHNENPGEHTPPDPEGERGDPIMIFNGNNLHVETDYAQAGLSSLEFKRTYNSIGTKSRMMGGYWTTTFDRYLILPEAPGGAVGVQRPDGKIIDFAPSGAQYLPRPHFLGRLAQSGTGWIFTDENKTIERFDSIGNLVSITDLQGRVLTPSYDRRSGRMSGVTANTGESLSFKYNASGRLASVTDHTGRVWTYTYDGWVNLVQVRKPDGLYWTHFYESPNGPRLLTGIAVGPSPANSSNERQVVWEYDAQGRATANYFPAIGLRKLELVEVRYENDGTRFVRHADGTEEVFHTIWENNQGWLMAVDGPAALDGGGRDLDRQFDTAMNITSVTKRGFTAAFGEFDSTRQPGYRIDAAGTPSARRVDIQYDTRFVNRPVRIEEPSVAAGQSKVTTLAYDAKGNPTEVTVNGFAPDGTPVSRTTTYAYDGPYGQLSQIDGPRTDVSDITRIEYDAANGRASAVLDPNGIYIRRNITYTPTGKLRSETRPNGLAVTYAYEAGTDYLQSITESQGATTRRTSWTYSDRGFVESITFSDGINADQSVGFGYDNAGNVLFVKSPAGEGYLPNASYVGFTIDDRGNVIGETTSRGGVDKRWLQRTFDAYNRVDRIITPNAIEDYDYKSDGTLIKSTDGRENTTTYQYDDFRRLTRRIEPGAVETTFAYNVHGAVTEVVAPNNATTRYAYDDLGNQLRLESPDSGLTRLSYNAAGQVTSRVDAKGQVTALSYDAGGRLRSVDRAGTDYDETYTYDSCVNGVGRLCSISNGLGETVSFAYDGLGQVAEKTTSAGTLRFAYNASGRISRLAYPSGRVVVYDYDAEGKATRVAVEENGARATLVDNVTREPFGPITGWTFGNGLAHSRTYDAQYWLQSMQSSGVINRSYDSYDGNGNLTGLTEAGVPHQYGYDAQNRLTSAAGAFGSIQYGYDASGNRSQEARGGSATSYSYAPSSNRLISDSNWSYALDANGNTIQRYDGSGAGRRFDYAENNRLTTVADLGSGAALASYRYNALGERSAKQVLGATTRYAYGLDGALLSESDASGIVQEYVYLDGVPIALLGRPQAPAESTPYDVIVDNHPATGDWVSQSDNKAVNGEYLVLNQRTQGFIDYQRWTWSVPPGNYDVYVWWMVPKGEKATTTTYTLNGEPVTVPHAGQVKGTWVKLGNYPILQGTAQLELSELPSMTVNLYADAARLVRTASAAQATNYQYVHADHLGTPLAVTNGNRQVVWQMTSEPFGSLAALNDDADGDGSPVVLNLRAPGQYFDAESGLYYNYFRTYDPTLGRYLESDPIGLQGGINTYAYANLNPVMFTDSLGLEASGSPWDCVQSCLLDNYGVLYELAGNLNPFTLSAAAIEIGTHELSRELRLQGTSYLNASTSLGASQPDAYNMGRRQLATLSQFSRLNTGLLVVGVGAAGYQLGGNAYCFAQCQ